jgi:hypothetical protein
MPKKNTKRKASGSPEHKKYCRCTPFCNKKLSRQVRRRHYKQVRDKPEQCDGAQDSATATEFDYSSCSEKKTSDAVETPTSSYSLNFIKGSSSVENLNSQVGYDGSKEESEDEEQVQVEVDERGHSQDEDVDITSSAVEDDKEQTSSGDESDVVSEGLGLGLGGGQGFEDHGSKFDEWREYREDDETAAIQSDVERLQEFDDILGAEEQAELWESHLCFTFCTLICFTNNSN